MKDAPLRPVGARVLIQPLYQNRTPGGLHIRHDFVEQNTSTGVVVAIGARARCKCERPDCDANMPAVKEGDVVLFPRLSESVVKVDWHGKEFLLVHAKDISIILNPKPNENTAVS